MEKHDEKLAKKAEELNQEQFSALHYTAPGTDIIIGLPKNHLWEGAGSYNARGKNSWQICQQKKCSPHLTVIE